MKQVYFERVKNIEKPQNTQAAFNIDKEIETDKVINKVVSVVILIIEENFIKMGEVI